MIRIGPAGWSYKDWQGIVYRFLLPSIRARAIWTRVSSTNIAANFAMVLPSMHSV